MPLGPALLVGVAFAALLGLLAGVLVWRVRRRGAGAVSSRPGVTVTRLPPISPRSIFRDRLSKTRDFLHTRLQEVFRRDPTLSAWLGTLEEALVLADVGVPTAQRLVAALRRHTGLDSPQAVLESLKLEICDLLQAAEPAEPEARPLVMLIVGVNGVGKTTTIAKLAHRYRQEGRKVLLVAADTFRAAAIEQLEIWAQRVGCDLVKNQHGADPSAVVFDGVRAARNRGADVAIIDTAGRLHVKVNLMEELKKLVRVISREMPGAPHETFLVLDACTGQNALSQARLFQQALPLTGIVLTKLDGTAKGGVVLAIKSELGLPLRYVGLGEGFEDLRPFDAKAFAEAVFASTSSTG